MPIVEASFASVAAKDAKGHLDRPLSRRLEAAMAGAAQACRDAGITDPNAIKERMMAAYRTERANG